MIAAPILFIADTTEALRAGQETLDRLCESVRDVQLRITTSRQIIRWHLRLDCWRQCRTNGP